jgi:hypothetical protein
MPTTADAKIYSCRGYVDLAREIGWPKSERGNIRRVMYRESRCRSTAWNPKDPNGGSHGLMQINGSNVGWAKRNGWLTNYRDLYNPQVNLKVSLELWKLYGWRPWAGSSSAP